MPSMWADSCRRVNWYVSYCPCGALISNPFVWLFVPQLYLGWSDPWETIARRSSWRLLVLHPRPRGTRSLDGLKRSARRTRGQTRKGTAAQADWCSLPGSRRLLDLIRRQNRSSNSVVCLNSKAIASLYIVLCGWIKEGLWHPLSYTRSKRKKIHWTTENEIIVSVANLARHVVRCFLVFTTAFSIAISITFIAF